MNLDDEIRKIRLFEKNFKNRLTPYWYGQGYWLKKFLGIPQFVPLLVHMDHGATLEDLPRRTDLLAKYPVFVTRQVRKDNLQSRFGKRAEVMGSPFVHYRRLMKVEKSATAKGTVAFPAHSTHLIEAMNDWDDYAQSLTALPPRFQPVKACIYWQDLLNGRHLHFQKYGIEVVTAGHIGDPSFTVNFYEILRNCEYATSNVLGSYTYYAVEMDIPFFLYGESPDFENRGGDMNMPQGTYSLNEQVFTEFEQQKEFFFDLSNPVTISPSVRKYCLEKLGVDHVVNKNSLRAVIFLSLQKNGPRRLAVKIYELLRKSMPAGSLN